MIRTYEELIQFLDVANKSAEGHRRPSYYYYTTLSTLASMLVTCKFRLANIMSPYLNDQFEPREFGKAAKWSRMFIACFAENAPDSNPMWGLYGVPADEAICLMIPQRTLEKVLNSTQNGYFVEKCSLGMLDWKWRGNSKLLSELFGKVSGSKRRIVLHDVAYFSNLHKSPNEGAGTVLEIYRDSKKIAEFDFSCKGFPGIEKLAGYIKRDVWMYENETRLQIEVPKDHDGGSVFIDLPRDFFQEISVTLGPNFNLNKNALKRVRNAGVNDVLTAFLDCRLSTSTRERALALSRYYGLLNYSTSGGSFKMREISAVPPAFFYGEENVLRTKWSSKPLWRQYHDLNDGK